METKENIHRFPRPMGITQMMHEYHQNKDPQILIQVKNYLINQWLMNNGVLCGIPYDINSFSQRLGIDINEVRLFMRDKVLNSKIWDKDRQEEIVQSLMGEQLAWALEDRMEISHQLDILRNSQNGKYTPFISAEVNKALKLKLEASTSLQSIVRTLVGGSTTNIFNQFNQQINNQQQEDTISIEEARSIILESQQALDKTAEVKYLEQAYDIGSLPEVVATKQEGVDTSKEGLTLNQNELNKITDNYKETLKETSREHHEMRREIEMRVDPDEPDPELEIYEEEEEEEPESIARTYLSH